MTFPVTQTPSPHQDQRLGLNQALSLKQLRADQVESLYRRGPVAVIITLLISGLVALVHWPTVTDQRLIAWLAATLVILSARTLLIAQYYRLKPAPERALQWGYGYAFATLMTGLCLGVSAPILFPIQSPEQQVFIVLVLGGMGAAAVPSLAVFPPAAVSYLLALCIPCIIAFISQPSPPARVLGLMIAIYLAWLLALSVSSQRSYIRTLRLDHENQNLLIEAQLANYDPLTQLPNRRLLLDRLSHAINLAQRRDECVALLYLDLDRFKLINDNLGHANGDAVLQSVAERLLACVRETDTVARMGGDEFVILLEGLSHSHQIDQIARKVLAALNQPHTLQKQPFFCGASIGISQFPVDGSDIDTLLKHADWALRRSKTQQRGSYQFFNAPTDRNGLDRLAVEHALRQALEQQQLSLHYQPQIELSSGRILGFEALLRWPHPEYRTLPPTTLIALAEDTGLIDDIGHWALTQACQDAKRWQQTRHTPIYVAINVSVRQFLQANFSDHVEQALQQTQLAPQNLMLEITESMLMQDTEHTIATLQQFSHRGIQLAVDDFGTGYSSLSYLSQFSLHWLKIDQQFVGHMTEDPDCAAIVTAIVTLAHSLGLRVIVEGIEDAAQLAFIQGRQADAVQGFHLSPALPIEQIIAWLHAPRMPPLKPANTMTTILILEDNEAEQELYRLLLEQAGYRVIYTDTAESALRMMAQQCVHVLLVDYVLPGIDGIEFLRRVRTIYPDAVRLLISAQADKDSLARAINEGGVFQYMQKPASANTLLSAVSHALVLHEWPAKHYSTDYG